MVQAFYRGFIMSGTNVSRSDRRLSAAMILAFRIAPVDFPPYEKCISTTRYD